MWPWLWQLWQSYMILYFSSFTKSKNKKRDRRIVLWDTLDMNNFYFLFLLFSDFIGILFSFSFSFLLDDEKSTWHCSHMTCHMMWCHRPRRWWKDLEDDVRAYVYNMVTLRQTWERSMDIRAGLIISSMDHEPFV